MALAGVSSQGLLQDISTRAASGPFRRLASRPIALRRFLFAGAVLALVALRAFHCQPVHNDRVIVDESSRRPRGQAPAALRPPGPVALAGLMPERLRNAAQPFADAGLDSRLRNSQAVLGTRYPAKRGTFLAAQRGTTLLRPSQPLPGSFPLALPRQASLWVPGRGPSTSLSRAPPPCAVTVPQELATAASLATLAVVIVIHELGHFTAARAQGIKVSEFSIGFGPQLLGRRDSKTGILFALRALPLGGYVAFPRFANFTWLRKKGLLKPGEELDSEFETENTPDLLENRPLTEQAIVAAAGVVANIVLTWSLFFSIASALGIPSISQPVVVSRVDSSSPAELAGFLSGDRVLSVGAENFDPFDILEAPPITKQTSSLDLTVKAIRGSIAQRKTFDTVVERGGTRVTLSVPPQPATVSSLGVVLAPYPGAMSRVQSSPSSAASYATESVISGSQEIFATLRLAFTTLLELNEPGAAQGSASTKLSGPIGIVRMGSQMATLDATSLVDFAGVISLNLAIINSLPLPGLDGWTLMLIAAEAIVRRPIPTEAKALANNAAVLFFALTFGRTFLSDLGDLGAGASGALQGPASDLASQTASRGFSASSLQLPAAGVTFLGLLALYSSPPRAKKPVALQRSRDNSSRNEPTLASNGYPPQDGENAASRGKDGVGLHDSTP